MVCYCPPDVVLIQDKYYFLTYSNYPKRFLENNWFEMFGEFSWNSLLRSLISCGTALWISASVYVLWFSLGIKSKSTEVQSNMSKNDINNIRITSVVILFLLTSFVWISRISFTNGDFVEFAQVNFYSRKFDIQFFDFLKIWCLFDYFTLAWFFYTTLVIA